MSNLNDAQAYELIKTNPEKAMKVLLEFKNASERSAFQKLVAKYRFVYNTYLPLLEGQRAALIEYLIYGKLNIKFHNNQKLSKEIAVQIIIENSSLCYKVLGSKNPEIRAHINYLKSEGKDFIEANQLALLENLDLGFFDSFFDLDAEKSLKKKEAPILEKSFPEMADLIEENQKALFDLMGSIGEIISDDLKEDLNNLIHDITQEAFTKGYDYED